MQCICTLCSQVLSLIFIPTVRRRKRTGGGSLEKPGVVKLLHPRASFFFFYRERQRPGDFL